MEGYRIYGMKYCRKFANELTRQGKYAIIFRRKIETFGEVVRSLDLCRR